MRLQRNLIVLMLWATALLAGCATEPVAPWERGTLARPEMQIDSDPLASRLAEQVYNSKEATSGGVGAAGAGCGCN